MSPPAPPLRDPQVYASADGQPLWLDVIGAQPGTQKPAVMWIHGGGLIFGSRTISPRPAFLQLLLARGFVVFAIDHRLAPETQLPAIVDDVLQAWQWVTTEGAARFGADPARTVIAGASAGAYLSLLAATRTTPRPRALAAFWGFGDILAPWETEPSAHYRQFDLVTPEAAREALSTSPVQRAGVDVDRSLFYLWCRQQGQWVQQVTGLHPQRDAAELGRWCPLRHIDAAFPPTVLVHGQADTDVPHEQSALLAAALAQQGVAHRFLSLPGAGHGFAGAQIEDAEAAETAVVDFLLQAIASTPRPG